MTGQRLAWTKELGGWPAEKYDIPSIISVTGQVLCFCSSVYLGGATNLITMDQSSIYTLDEHMTSFVSVPTVKMLKH